MSTGLLKNLSKSELKNTNQIRSSEARKIKEDILKNYPAIADHMEEIWPKKVNLHATKCSGNITLYSLNSEVVFFQEKDSPIFPTVRLLHLYPNIMPRVQVDRGAIKHVLSGAKIMCPGVTSPGGILPEDLEKGTAVAIFAENKSYALAVGLMAMSSKQIKEENKGLGIENVHYCGDGLYKMQKV